MPDCYDNPITLLLFSSFFFFFSVFWALRLWDILPGGYIQIVSRPEFPNRDGVTVTSRHRTKGAIAWSQWGGTPGGTDVRCHRRTTKEQLFLG